MVFEVVKTVSWFISNVDHYKYLFFHSESEHLKKKGIWSLGANVTLLVRVVFLYANKYKVFNSLCSLILRLNIVKCQMKSQAQTPTA